MKMIEITFRKHQKELEKLNAQLERAEKTYEKKLAVAQKYGVAEWTTEDRNEWLQTVPKTDFGYIINKADVKKHGAWFDLSVAENSLKDIKSSISRAEQRMEKSEKAVSDYHKQIEQIADLKQKEELMKAAFEKEQKEWAKDGIILESRYSGLTPQGKRFYIAGNCGITERSFHCFQLTVDGQTIFTSGEFWRAYSEIKKR